MVIGVQRDCLLGVDRLKRWLVIHRSPKLERLPKLSARHRPTKPRVGLTRLKQDRP